MTLVPYVSIDIETTGLNPATCQVLEIGAVIDDFTKPIADLPRLRIIVAHDEIHGEPYAMSMHPQLLRTIALKPSSEDALTMPHKVVERFNAFLAQHGIDMKIGFQPAGKNFASFDKPFLEAGIPNWKKDVKIKHRTIDPGNLYWHPGIEYLPDSKTCNERAGIQHEVAHTALEDALDVVAQVRTYKANLERVERMLESGRQFTEAFGHVQAALHPSLVVNVNDPEAMAQDIIRNVEESRDPVQLT